MKIDQTKIELLKQPFGVLIKDNDINKKSLNLIFDKAQKIITVGDTTTEKLINLGFTPDVSVIDGKEKRLTKNRSLAYPVDRILYFENKPGELNEQVIEEIKKLSSSEFEDRVQFIIEGEEDLVALPLLIFSRDDWIICYGQPDDGLVVVHVNEESRKRAKLIFNKVFNI